MLVVAGLNLALYFEVLSHRATKLSGEKKKAFCKKVSERLDSPENLKFGKAKIPCFSIWARTSGYLAREKAEYLPLGRKEYKASP